jgi:PASTA domain
VAFFHNARVRRKLIVLASVLVLSSQAAGSLQSDSAPAYRYIYDADSAAGTALSHGWNLIDVGSQWSADRLPRGAEGLVWVGDYDNSSCSWQMSDPSLESHVRAAVADAKVFGYFISDEPNPNACPDAPAQHRARSNLIHAIDPRARTVIVLDSNGFAGQATPDALEQLPRWKGTADYIGLDPYPCYRGAACDFSWIARTIRAANAAGLNYWGVVQAFDGDSWRWPTASELSRMLAQWAGSKETGYMAFAWSYAGNDLSSKPALLDVLTRFNHSGPTSPRCVVPKVVGLMLATARAAIERADCVVGAVTHRASTRGRGLVLSQQPRPATRLAARGRVNLVISTSRS